MFDNNFGKCGSIFKILSPIDSLENSVCIHHKNFHLTCSVLLHYLVKFDNPKMLRNFPQNVLRNMSTEFVEDAVKISNIFGFPTFTR